MAASYAVLFKTHFWDDFNRRQLERLKLRVGRGDIYVVIDETFTQAPAIEHDKIIAVTKSDLESLNLALVTTHGSIIWYNNDYPNYAAAAKIPDYDFLVSIEYDVVVNIELDQLIDKLAAGGIDFLGFPLRKKAAAWPWYPMHKDLYGLDMLVSLSCLAIFSRAGMTALLTKRQKHSAGFAAGTLRYWPHVEAFLPNEIKNAGLKQASLTAYGNTEYYDWWPPFNETNLPEVASQAFIHPVLHGTRFARSTIFHEPSVLAFFRHDSECRRKLEGFNPELVNKLIRAEIKRRIGGKVLRLLQGLGLRKKWFSRAQSGISQGGAQEQLPHNAS